MSHHLSAQILQSLVHWQTEVQRKVAMERVEGTVVSSKLGEDAI